MEDSNGTEVEIEREPAAAMRLAGSYAAHAFLTNEAARASVLNDPLVLIADHTISSMEDILPALEHLVQMTRCFVLVGNAVEGEALSTLAVNKLRGTFDCLAINVAPRDTDRLYALSQLTGATLFGPKTGRSLRSARPADFGSARSVESTCRETLFTAYADRLAIGALHTLESVRTVVRIKVGAATQAEQRWTKSCIQSALASARGAMEEGCVPGGGVALLRAAKAIEPWIRSGAGAAGARVLLDAAAAPLQAIAANAGCDPEWIAAEVGRLGTDIGWDASTGQFGSMRAFGILDPVRVVRAALCTAVSLAAVTFDSAALVTHGS